MPGSGKQELVTLSLAAISFVAKGRGAGRISDRECMTFPEPDFSEDMKNEGTQQPPFMSSK
jgi:hypothetical protein